MAGSSKADKVFSKENTAWAAAGYAAALIRRGLAVGTSTKKNGK